MTCSKIFLGDLPELIDEIIQYFRKDYLTLHSCILVNRLWCRLAIPLLWEDPFSIPTKNYHFIEIYLYYLNEDDKTKLEISDNLFPSNTLFNYPSFIKFLDTCKIIDCIYVRKGVAFSSPPSQHHNVRLIYKTLLKTFIENEACLRALTISDLYISYFNDVLELILQNPNFIHNIKSLKMGIICVENNIILNKIITLLSSNCNLISTLDTRFSVKSYNSSQIIKSQQNLKKITFFFESSLYHSLLSLNNSNCTNTLKTLIFSRVNFQNIVILNEVFKQLNVLESVHFLNCPSLDFKQIINITKPFKLKSLLMMHQDFHFDIELFQLLLQKYGNDLENIGLSLQKSSQSKQKLFELITKYCTKIKFFDFFASFGPNIYLVLDLIKNIRENLNYLSIGGSDRNYSIILKNLGQILPLKLEYLNLPLSTNISDFEVFLKNSQNTFINTLLICISEDIGENFLPYMEKYIMKKKRVKYLAFECSSLNAYERWLVPLKDVVKKKFKLYNIEVQDYYDLYIDHLHNRQDNMFLDIFQ